MEERKQIDTTDRENAMHRSRYGIHSLPSIRRNFYQRVCLQTRREMFRRTHHLANRETRRTVFYTYLRDEVERRRNSSDKLRMLCLPEEHVHNNN